MFINEHKMIPSETALFQQYKRSAALQHHSSQICGTEENISGQLSCKLSTANEVDGTAQLDRVIVEDITQVRTSGVSEVQ